jgi:tetratricopeptide (TPR) repeat protein
MVGILGALLAAAAPAGAEKPAVAEDLEQQADKLQADDLARADLLYRASELYETRWLLAKQQVAQAADAKAREQAEKEAQAALARTLATLTRLVDDPALASWPKMDDAMMRLAALLGMAGDRVQSRARWTALIKRFPRSRWVPGAYVAIGDDAFNQGDMKLAGAYFDKALEFPKAPIYTYALYKRGWVHVNEQKPREAFAKFVEVVRRDKAALRRAALVDAGRVYADFGDARKARVVFVKVAGKDAPLMMKAAAQAYGMAAKWKAAAIAWGALVALDPTNPDACTWRGERLAALAAAGAPKSELAQERADATTAGCP